jgi:hypothetical protein
MKPKRLTIAQVVESEGQEDDTYWIYLKYGFHNGSGEHAIAENDKRAARSRITDVTVCYCEECASKCGVMQ